MAYMFGNEQAITCRIRVYDNGSPQKPMVVLKNKSYSDPLFSRVREKRAASGRRVFQRIPEEIVRTFDMSMRDDGINISIGQRESSVIGIGT